MVRELTQLGIKGRELEMKGMKASEHLIYYMFAYGMRTAFVFLGAIAIGAIVTTLNKGSLVTVGLIVVTLPLVFIQLAVEYALRRYRKNWLAAQLKTDDDERVQQSGG